MNLNPNQDHTSERVGASPNAPRREEVMKYMIEWTVRTVGLTHDQNFASLETLQTTFSKWKPEKGLTVLAFVGNVAGRSDYVLVEANDPEIVSDIGTISMLFR
jgi:hypothetical protein